MGWRKSCWEVRCWSICPKISLKFLPPVVSSSLAVCRTLARLGVNLSTVPLAQGAKSVTGSNWKPMCLAKAWNSCPLNGGLLSLPNLPGIPKADIILSNAGFSALWPVEDIISTAGKREYRHCTTRRYLPPDPGTGPYKCTFYECGPWFHRQGNTFQWLIVYPRKPETRSKVLLAFTIPWWPSWDSSTAFCGSCFGTTILLPRIIMSP